MISVDSVNYLKPTRIESLKYIIKNILAEKHYGWQKYLNKSNRGFS